MRRRHLVELEDLPWFPRVLRDGATTYLAWITARSGQIEYLVPPLEALLRRTAETEIVDLCSGGAGPMPEVVARLRARGLPVHATLTDFYPNVESLARACAESAGALRYSAKSVDAMRVPDELAGVRTLWNAFHHFRPAQAREILGSAVRARRPIAVFEVLTRQPLHLVSLCVSPLVALLTVPFWRPFRASWLFFSWVVPLIPFVILCDGIVSWLRIYSDPELRELVSPFASEAYDWQIGRIRLGRLPVHASYLLGAPRPS
ncbi:MAG TPA: class I SAM-dependent methyltransferase [Myxococcota bacterium]|nr:class I SAM-dependent methyltransferase [Myxococcota bacterium]